MCVSVIEKVTKNQNEEAIFRESLKWQEEENSDNAFQVREGMSISCRLRDRWRANKKWH